MASAMLGGGSAGGGGGASDCASDCANECASECASLPPGLPLSLPPGVPPTIPPRLSSCARAALAASSPSLVWVTQKPGSPRSCRGEGTSWAEGERKGEYPEGTYPNWVSVDGDVTTVTLPKGHEVRYYPDHVEYDVPGYGTISAKSEGRGVEARLALTASNVAPTRDAPLKLTLRQFAE